MPVNVIVLDVLESVTLLNVALHEVPDGNPLSVKVTEYVDGAETMRLPVLLA